jgi:hypothetical protein
MNDVNSIAEILPRMPTIFDWAVIRSGMDSASPRELVYEPYNVVQALLWLEQNNPLWEGKFQRPPGSQWENSGTRERHDTEIITADESDYLFLGSDMQGVSGPDGNPVNPNAPETNMTDVFLVSSDDDQDLLSQVNQVIEPLRYGGFSLSNYAKCYDYFVIVYLQATTVK